MMVAQVLGSLDGVKKLIEIHGDNEKQQVRTHQRLPKIIMYYFYLFCLLVYLKNNLKFALMVPFLSSKLH